MKNKGDLSTWSLKELRAEERTFGTHDMNATEYRTEIARRQADRGQWSTWISVIAAIISASTSVVAIFHSK